MNKYAAYKLAEEYYNLGAALSLHKIAAVSGLPRILLGTGGKDLMTGIAAGKPGGLEAYVLGKMVNNADKDLSKLTAILKSRK